MGLPYQGESLDILPKPFWCSCLSLVDGNRMSKVGQFCTGERQEMILLSDILGISALVDAINSAQAQSESATVSSVLGPFHSDAHVLENGISIGSEGVIGEPMLIDGTVRATDGTKIEGVSVDVWETNGNGFYDMQDPSRKGPDCRGVFRTDSDGRFYLMGVKSVDYNIPDEGPVGVLLRHLGRRSTRPAHVVRHRGSLVSGIDFVANASLPALPNQAPKLHRSHDCSVLSRK